MKTRKNSKIYLVFFFTLHIQQVDAFFFHNLEIQAQKWDYFEIFGSIDIDWNVWLGMKKATGTLKYFTISSKNSFLNNACSVWSKEMKFNGVTSLYKNKHHLPPLVLFKICIRRSDGYSTCKCMSIIRLSSTFLLWMHDVLR